jgi:hypothetical protein
MQRDDPSEAPSIERFLREHGRRNRAEFLDIFQVPLLVQMTEPNPTAKAIFHTTPSFGTLVIDAGTLRQATPLSIQPLAKRDSNPFSAMVTVGRAHNNDVVFPYDEVSKFHAFFLRTPSGWALVDAHSTNGTFVSGRRLRPPEPCHLDLSPGSLGLAFSGIKAILYAPERLYEVARAGELVA